MVDWKAHCLWRMLSGVKGKKLQRYVLEFISGILFSVFTWRQQNSNEEIIDSSEFLLSRGIKNVRVERVLDFPIEDA